MTCRLTIMNEDTNLKRQLQTWQVDTPLSSRFKRGVWQRIEEGQAQPANTALWRLSAWLETVFAVPVLRMSFATMIALLGVAGGLLHAHHQQNVARENSRARYVQSVDPIQLAAKQ